LQPSWPASCVATPEADDGECDGEPVGSSTYNLLKDRQPQELPIGLSKTQTDGKIVAACFIAY